MSDDAPVFHIRHRSSREQPWTYIDLEQERFGFCPFALCDRIRDRIHGKPTAEQIAAEDQRWRAFNEKRKADEARERASALRSDAR